VMDATAIALCRSNAIPIMVFNMKWLFDNRAIVNLLARDRCDTLQGTLVQGH